MKVFSATRAMLAFSLTTIVISPPALWVSSNRYSLLSFQPAVVKSSTLTDSGQSLVQIMDSEPWRTMVEQQRIGTLKPAFPVLVTHSALDDTIPYDQGKAMAKSWCAKGANVRFSTNLNPGHLGGMLVTSTEMYGFFEARFAGLPQWSNCWIL